MIWAFCYRRCWQKKWKFSRRGNLLKTRTSHVVLSLDKVEDRWKISDPGNLEIAVIGGFERDVLGATDPVS